MSTYLGQERTLVDTWIEGRLVGDTGLNTISTGLGSRIYLNRAPSTAVYPFIIYQAQVPPRDIRGVGLTRVMVDTLYVVKAVAQVDTFAGLGTIAKRVDELLTEGDPSAVGDGYVLACVREEQFSLDEMDGGKQFLHLGGVYKILAQA